MTAGKLFVTPCTIHGLPQNGYPTSQTFIGCFVSPSEKQRTNSASGPEPHFNDTLQCNVGENDQTLSIDVINEDPSRPGHIGSGQVSLSSVFSSGKFEDWVPLTASNGSPLGYIYMKLNFTPSQPREDSESQYRVPPPLPPAYQGQGSSGDTKTEVSEHSTRGPEGLQQRDNSSGSFNHSLPPPGYTPPPASTPDSYNASSTPMSPGTRGGAQSPFMAVCPPGPAGTPPVAAPLAEKKKKEIPDWVKYGGAALAGAAVVGVGSWAMGAYDGEEDEEEKIRVGIEAQKRAENEALYRSILARAQQQREAESYQSREIVHQEPEEEAAEEEPEEEEEAEEEQEEEQEEEEEEEAEEEAEENDRPYVNDSKWR